MSDQSHVNNDVKLCLKIFPLLAALILITVAVHMAHLPYNVQIVIELVKVCIVVGYFIHLIANRKEINNVWWITISVVIGLLFLPWGNFQNHIVGTVDTSKEFQMEQLASKTTAESHEESHTEEHVH